MKNLIFFIGGFSIFSQSLVLTLNETKISNLFFNFNNKLLEIDKDMTDGFYVKGYNPENVSNLGEGLKVFLNKKFGTNIYKKSVSTLEQNNTLGEIRATYKMNYIENDQKIEKMFQFDNFGKLFELKEENEEFIYEQKQNVHVNSDLLGKFNTITGTFGVSNYKKTLDNRYIIYRDLDKTNLGSFSFFDTSTDKVLGGTVVVPGLSKESDVYKIYSPTGISNSETSLHKVFFVVKINEKNEIFSVDLNELVESGNGTLDNFTSDKVITAEKTKFSEANSIVDTNGRIQFYIDHNNNVSVMSYNNNFLNSSDDFTSSKKITNLEKGSEISYITNTAHNLFSNDNIEYTIFAATKNVSDSSKKTSSVYYLDNTTYEAVELFELDRQVASNGFTIEPAINNFVSYYDELTKKYNIVVSTPYEIYSYSYLNIADFGKQNGKATARKIFNLEIKTNNENPLGISKISKDSLTLFKNKIRYSIDGLDDSRNRIEYYSSIFEKIDLSSLQTVENLKLKVSDELMKSKLDIKKEFLYEEVKNYYLNNLTDPLIAKIFSKAKLQSTNEEDDSWEYSINISDEVLNKLFPNNQFGNIDISEPVELIANEENYYGSFTSVKSQNVSLNYNNKYDLSNLNSLLAESWDNKVLEFDDYNNIIGWVYNSIEMALTSLSGYENLFFKKEGVINQPIQYEVNEWSGNNNEVKNDNDQSWLTDWGFFKNETKLDENGYKNVELDNILIRSIENSDLFFISENSTSQNWVKLPKLKVKFKDDTNNLSSKNTIFNEQELKNDLDEVALKMENLEFTNLNFTSPLTDEQLTKLEISINKNEELMPGYGLVLLNNTDMSNLSEKYSKLKVNLYNRAFNFERNITDENGVINKETNSVYKTIEISFSGEKEENNNVNTTENNSKSLKIWLIPVIVFSIVIPIFGGAIFYLIKRKHSRK